MKNPRKNVRSLHNDIRWEIYGILIICAGILGISSIYTDTVGTFGLLLKKNLRGMAGAGAPIIPSVVIVWGLYCILRKKSPDFTPRIYGLLMIMAITLVVLHISLHVQLLNLSILDRIRKSADMGEKGMGGGLLGELGTSILYGLFGPIGTYVVIGALLCIGIILATGVSISGIIKSLVEAKREKSAVKRPQIVNNAAAAVVEKANNKEDEKELDMEKTLILTAPDSSEADEKSKTAKTAETSDLTICADKQFNDSEYSLPPVSLLQKSSSKQGSFSEKELLNNAQILEKTLESFGIQARVVQVSCGPAITRFEVQPSPGVKVSRIVSLSDDIALSLAVPDVRIEAPIPGKAAIGIEVPNREISKVYFRDVIESPEFKNSASKLTIALGKDIAGKSIVADLADMPHLLIAGATGSGKSVCINTIITSILYKASPHEVKFMMIDPKVVELTTYNGIPHLLTPVLTDPKKAAAALNWMVSEMERRYQLFAQAGVREINRYNEISQENKLPKIVVIIDELADLMMVSPRDVEDSICRLAQMARAAGIHLVVATQRPSVDVITGLIKANIPSRISFAVSSQVDSRTILDMAGAEKLLGKGDMLFFPVGAAKPIRIQGAFLSEKEVEYVVEFIKKQMKPCYEKNLSDFKEPQSAKSDDNVDELFKEAVSVVIETGQASVSLLQRKLRIGYARAARLIDQMEEKGFIGGYEGTKPRQILITKEQFEKFFGES
ncbi:DNA translocase FtsK [Thermosediminibacter oceani]|uniref:DNA translocase FtsK n=1 Tax=Thermosediminibacter oceani (strain ATCC BAA-1034 / DSM 16646 / JW/IW-1228P) TaxID=555079 RepID=D9S3K3_THEOJ|nr:DNA translocase FtsK [Thermosediminibacter oceani]ADL07980.1 DNA translocase FtsK [Thermosediminibacter oceani DSM 16646]